MAFNLTTTKIALLGWFRVDLDVAFGSGELQLDEDHLEVVEFEFASCSVRRYPNWKCRGNGKGRTMTFITVSQDLIASGKASLLVGGRA
jgi:hypothetical protein